MFLNMIKQDYRWLISYAEMNASYVNEQQRDPRCHIGNLLQKLGVIWHAPTDGPVINKVCTATINIS